MPAELNLQPLFEPGNDQWPYKGGNEFDPYTTSFN
jgi:hypothetical protein